jgi:formylglycine-generating enzyme required for sulfatase activity
LVDQHVLLAVTARGEQRLAFPVTFGSEPEAAVALPGAMLPVVALVGLEGGRPFIQSQAPGAVRIDGEPVVGSAWLHPGSAVEIAGTSFAWTAPASGVWSLVAAGADVADTRPPEAGAVAGLTAVSLRSGPAAGEVPDVRDQASSAATAQVGDAERIAPVAFQRAAPQARQRRGIPLSVPLGLVAAAFLVGLWFVFTAHSVVIDVSPTPEEVRVTGGLFNLPVGERRLMRSGRYRVLASLEGYHPLDEVLEVDQRAAQEYTFEMRKLPGQLLLEVDPPIEGAQVSVDGAPVGNLPRGAIELEPGPHIVAVTAPRYQPVEQAVEIEGLGREQRLALTLPPDWAVVRVETRPEGAQIRVDDELLGTTPADVEILSGQRQLALKLPGYKRVERTLAVRAGEPQALTDIELAPADGLVSLRSDPSGAIVTVDGRFRGRTPVELELAPGRRYRLQFTKAGYESASRSLTVESGVERALAVTLEAKTGTVLVDVSPADAEVFVGGRRLGSGPQRVELPAVEQRIEARLAGYADGAAVVTPQPGFEQRVTIELATEAAAAYAAIPKRPVVGGDIQMLFVDPERQPGSENGLLRFRMGSSRRDADRLANEVQYEVELTRAFYVSIKEITNAQFRRFRADHRSGSVGQYSLEAPDQPVVRVSWQDAVAFCNWLSRQEGLAPAYVNEGGNFVPVSPMTNGYRLPTEAEWAWLARYSAGETLRFPWGDRLPPADNSGNYAGVEARVVVGNTLSTYEDNFVGSAPVGSYAPGRLGLYDLGGNVAEWVHDRFGINVDPGPLRDPLGPKLGRQWVIRGSSYLHGGATELRFSYRDFDDREREDVGFRVARYYR